ncbi:hypothetical protein ACFQ0K_05685 [Nocardioides caeni]|uniref:Uncharacterized protein n=1 Tax=Nocardioides caeni TaxID=574700 RepID=A0A4S8N7C8_9ACTN|nr:hypothetical protein [Nocardioides caeni]THV12177.1 hypothetical protein E9934_12595 [Nocardioides caeni]
MTIELTSALLALTVAGLCALWLTRSRPAVEQIGVTALAGADEWRLAALRHFQEHRDLQRSVVVALATPGAVSGIARYDLADAIGHDVIERPRVDLFV